MNKLLSVIGTGFFISFTVQAETWIPALEIFILVMIVDYISGVLAAKKDAIEHPEDIFNGLSSKKGVLGIIKKIGYMLIITIAFLIDYVISSHAQTLMGIKDTKIMFGWITLIWFALNEMLSVIENLGRIGVPIPSFLKKIITELKNKVDDNTHK